MSTLTRVAVTSTATLSHTFVVGEAPTDATGTVTVAVTDATGVLVGSGNAAKAAGTGVYTYNLPAQSQTAALTVAWTGTLNAAPVTETDFVEVVGGFYFTLAEARASDPSLADTTKYPTAGLAQARLEVEQELDRICGRAFVVRYRRLTLDGSGSIDLMVPDGGDDLEAGVLLRGVRAVRSASMAPAKGGGTFVALTTPQLAALKVTADGQVRRTDGIAWTEGIDNVLMEYEYGSDFIPSDLKAAALTRLRVRLNLVRSGIPDDVASYTTSEGTFRRTLPDAFRTGNPYVDAVYARYSRRPDAGNGAAPHGPAARVLQYDPQRYSLFHGARRGSF